MDEYVTTTCPSTQQVLLNAADLVERGWTQGTFAAEAIVALVSEKGRIHA